MQSHLNIRRLSIYLFSRVQRAEAQKMLHKTLNYQLLDIRMIVALCYPNMTQCDFYDYPARSPISVEKHTIEKAY